jgi:MOSC domain-containing protein YiiM
MIRGNLVAIHIGEKAGGEIQAVSSIRAVSGQGLEGDRNFRAEGDPKGKPDQEVTLIESEALEAMKRDHGVEITGADSRRNLLTRGVSLNHLVGKEFRIGEVKLLGLRLCEPCGHLEKLTKPGVVKGLIHRGGLRAQILQGGTIRRGDVVEEIPTR